MEGRNHLNFGETTPRSTGGYQNEGLDEKAARAAAGKDAVVDTAATECGAEHQPNHVGGTRSGQ